MPEEFDDLYDGFVSRSEAKKLAREEFQKILTDVNTFGAQAQAGVSNAIRELQAAHPDFESRRPQMLAVLEQIPLLKDAVSSAESNPQLAPALPQIYETVYRASKDTASTATSEPSESGARPDLSSEGTQYQAALASQRVDLSPANRKALIAELERRGVNDIEF